MKRHGIKRKCERRLRESRDGERNRKKLSRKLKWKKATFQEDKRGNRRERTIEQQEKGKFWEKERDRER